MHGPNGKNTHRESRNGQRTARKEKKKTNHPSFKQYFEIIVLYTIFVSGLAATLMGVNYAEHITIGALVAILFRLGS